MAGSFWGGRPSPRVSRSVLCCVQSHTGVSGFSLSFSSTWTELSHLRLGKHKNRSMFPGRKENEIWWTASSLPQTDFGAITSLIYIYIYIAIYSRPNSFFHIIPLALNCITTSGYPSLLALISLQEELRTKRTIQDGGGLPWNSGLPWQPPETLTDVTSTVTAATNMHPHPGASASSPALFRPSTHITLCMKYEWAEFFIILGYLIAQIVTETEGEETHCWKRKKWIRCLVRTDWNAKEKMTE